MVGAAIGCQGEIENPRFSAATLGLGWRDEVTLLGAHFLLLLSTFRPRPFCLPFPSGHTLRESVAKEVRIFFCQHFNLLETYCLKGLLMYLPLCVTNVLYRDHVTAACTTYLVLTSPSGSWVQDSGQYDSNTPLEDCVEMSKWRGPVYVSFM